MTISSVESRPHYDSPRDWLDDYFAARTAGRHGWQPATRGELLLAESVGLIADHPEWIPGPQGLALLGLPRWWGRRQRPQSPRWQERLVQTLLDYPETVAALRGLIIGGPAV